MQSLSIHDCYLKYLVTQGHCLLQSYTFLTYSDASLQNPFSVICLLPYTTPVTIGHCSIATSRISSPQNENFLIIYSPQCHPRCSCLSFFSGKEIKFFEENISGFFSTQWTSTVTKLLKSKSMQFHAGRRQKYRPVVYKVNLRRLIQTILNKLTKIHKYVIQHTINLNNPPPPRL